MDYDYDLETSCVCIEITHKNYICIPILFIIYLITGGGQEVRTNRVVLHVADNLGSGHYLWVGGQWKWGGAKMSVQAS